MSVSMSEAPMEWIIQMKKKEKEFLGGKISAETLIILAGAFERNAHKEYWADKETLDTLIELGFSDDKEENGARISQYVKRTNEELKEIASFNRSRITSWRDSLARKELSQNKEFYLGKTLIWIPPFTLQEEKEYTFIGIGDKSIVCIDSEGEKHFFWFNIPKYVAIKPSYKNAHGHGYSIAKQFVSKYANKEIKRRIGI